MGSPLSAILKIANFMIDSWTAVRHVAMTPFKKSPHLQHVISAPGMPRNMRQRHKQVT